MFVEAEGRDIAVARDVSVINGNGGEAIHQVFDAGVRTSDVVFAHLSEEAVAFLSSAD
jgi:hypothetical protein